MKKINSLTGLRFLFILPIVLCHFANFNVFFNSYSLLDNGRFGVIFFFMISGFGLTFKNQTTNATLLNGKVTLKSSIQFGIKRISKIYLLYIITTLLMVPLTTHRFITQNLNDGILIPIAKVIINLCIAPTLLQSTLGISYFSNMFNSVSWFLSTIFVLYMFYPLLEKFNNKVMKKNPYLWIIIIIILSELFRFLLRYIGTKINQVDELVWFEYVSPFSRVFDFVTGMIIADIFIDLKNKKIEKLKFANLYEPLLIALAIFAWVFLPSLTKNDLAISIVSRFIIISTIFVFAFENGFMSKFFSSKPLVTMGNVTMYIFLIHFCVLLNVMFLLGLIMEWSLTYWIICVILTIVITAVWVLCIHLISKKKKKKNIETAAEQKTEIETQNETIN